MKSDLFGAAATLVAAAAIDERMFASTYANVFEGNPAWNAIQVAEGDLFAFDESSTYIQDPPFFQDLTLDVPRVDDIRARGSSPSSATP